MKRARHAAAAALLLLAGCRLFGDGIERGRVRNLIVVTMDTTRADHIGAYGHAGIKTPHIDAMAARGVLFEEAITPVPLTLPSHTSLFTGLLPTHHGVRNNGTYVVPKSLETLAETLRRDGFRTGAVIGAYVLDSKYGLDQGFQTYDDNLHGGKEGPMFMFDERLGQAVADAGITWIEANGEQRFFLWLHFFDPHANYEPPPPFDVLYDGAPYDGEIAYVDAQLGRLVEALDATGQLDDTLIVVTSDHGEGLGEHGEKTHSMLLHDATLHVPLVMSHPALPQAARVRGPVRTIDVMPTALDLLGVRPRAAMDGESLAPVMAAGEADREAYVETLVTRFNNGWAELRGVRTGDSKYVRAPRPELYDLDADPGELRNLHGERPERARELAGRLDAYLASDEMLGGEQARVRLGAADRERLAALGYNVDEAGDIDPSDLPDPKDMIGLWEELQAAQTLMRARKSVEAEQALRAYLAKEPGNVLARSSLANALMQLGRASEAQTEFEAILVLDPRRSQPRIALSRLKRRQGDLDGAFALLKTALADDQDSPELANEFADLFQEAGQPDKAVQWYEEALRRDPRYVKALIGRSNTHHRAGRNSQARADLDRALAADPRNADALYNLGVVIEEEGKKEEATALYRRALEADPEHVPALNNLANHFEQAGETARALAIYRRVVELNPAHFEATYNLGTLLLRAEQPAEAIPPLERALELNPKAGVAHNNLATAYAQAGRLDDARLTLTRVAEADPKQAIWWLRLARVEAQMDRPDDARLHLARAVSLGGARFRKRIAADPLLAPLAPPHG